MYTTKIEIRKTSTERNEYNEVTLGPETTVAVTYAQRTDHGGTENLYASRIVHENEVIFTVRYRAGIEAGQYVIAAGKRLKVISVHEEGRKKVLHLKCMTSDGYD